ncbi:MAG: aspartate-semialdehyde dehydrogenase [Firmicutes bacterium]|nr:aspartate-semialdehyde dehydrogenase [Bacillota bacterium]
MAFKVAIVGATGAVGQELLKVLRERRFPVADLKLLASARSAGTVLEFAGQKIEVEEARPSSFAGVDIAFFSAGGSVSQQLVPAAVDRGALVIDNTSAFRMKPDVPLVVPEVNPEDCREHHGIIANPNCSTIIMAVALYPLHRLSPLRRVIVSTYQAVSGAGARAMAELVEQVKAFARGQELQASILPYAAAPKHFPIAFNLIPHIDVFQDGGYTKEEWKMVLETRKILHEPDLPITATTVRVPVLRCHSESINVETEEKLTAVRVREALAAAPGVKVADDPQNQVYPMPLELAGSDDVYVGRIREDLSHPRAVNLWVVGDQIRKGAALNAVQIAEYCAQRGWIGK